VTSHSSGLEPEKPIARIPNFSAASGNGVVPSSMLLFTTSLYKPRLGSIVQAFEILPHSGVDRAPLNLYDWTEMLPSHQDRHAGCVDDNLLVKQTLLHD
jgi:hypothetical protein